MLKEIERWTEKRKDGHGSRSYANYRCSCGKIFKSTVDNVKRGNTQRCKECAKNTRSIKNSVHGHSYSSKTATKLEKKCYYTWQAMKRRCLNETDSHYQYYGGRGVKICQRWLNSYQNFLDDMGLQPNMLYSIERDNNDGNYKPSNCRWIPVAKQGSNKSNNHNIEVDGIVKTLAEWSRASGVNTVTIRNRIERGWPPEKAILPIGSAGLMKYRTPDSDFASLPKLAEHYGMSVSGVDSRIKSKSFPEWVKIRGSI